MKLWTIQTPDVLDIIQSKGVYFAKWTKTYWHANGYPKFHLAYKWMTAQMKQRNIPVKKYAPVWAWYTQPDLRHSAHLPPKTKGICLAMDVPDRLVLLSDFETWHCVLNDSYLALTEQEFEKKHSKREKERSWERVFLLGAGDPKWLGQNRAVQATIPRIEQAWVKKVTHFTAR